MSNNMLAFKGIFDTFRNCEIRTSQDYDPYIKELVDASDLLSVEPLVKFQTITEASPVSRPEIEVNIL